MDFADIRQEFDATNKAYFDELQAELGDEMEHYSKLFKSQEEIFTEIEHVKNVLFRFNIENEEVFSQQLSELQGRESVLALKKCWPTPRNVGSILSIRRVRNWSGSPRK